MFNGTMEDFREQVKDGKLDGTYWILTAEIQNPLKDHRSNNYFKRGVWGLGDVFLIHNKELLSLGRFRDDLDRKLHYNLKVYNEELLKNLQPIEEGILTDDVIAIALQIQIGRWTDTKEIYCALMDNGFNAHWIRDLMRDWRYRNANSPR